MHILVHADVDEPWFLVHSEPLPPAQTLLLTLQAPLKTENRSSTQKASANDSGCRGLLTCAAPESATADRFSFTPASSFASLVLREPPPPAHTLLLTVQLHQKLETENKKLPFQRDGTVARPPSDGDTEL